MIATSTPDFERVLLFSARWEQHLYTRHLIAGGLAVTSTASGPELEEWIRVGVGAVMIDEKDLSDELVPHLVAVLEHQPAWSDVPIIVLMGEMAKLDVVLDRLGPVTNVSFVERSSPPSTLASTVRVALRARARQVAARDLYGVAERDRRKDEFLAMLGHELRNPLGAISNSLSVLDELAPREDPPRRLHQSIIARQVRSLTRLVDDLLDVSRVTHGKIELEKRPVELKALVSRWFEAYGQSRAVKNHHLEMELPKESLFVEGDTVRLEQVLSNLLSNALKYTADGGRILVSVVNEGGVGVLRVRDTGVGIERELLPRVFELFTQSRRQLARSQGGLGLGLALVRSLVQLHGGSVSAESGGLGAGTEITVRLPLSVPPTSLDARDPLGVQAAVPGLRVLIVEDNDDARDGLESLLEMWGSEVETAADGLTGLERIVSRDPDLVLMDIGLPELDGHQAAKRACERLGENRPFLVAMTGYGQPDDRRRAMEAGFDTYLVKPLNADQLREALQLAASHGRSRKLAYTPGGEGGRQSV